MKTAITSLMAALMLVFTTTATKAFWPADADTIFNSYNNAFYVSSGGNAIYKMNTGTGTGPGWWTFAEEIEMTLDAYGRTGSTGTRDMVTALCNGFISHYGTLWTSNMFNDDIMWATIAFARAYQITGNTTFRNCAKSNFDAVYARAWDSNLGGGLWWTTAKNEKNACVNSPGAIAAYLLYQIYSDSSYLTKSQNMYNWVKNVLFVPGTGAVYDNINSSGVINTWTFTYNQGTFIGAANYLGQVADATSAANFTRDTMCSGGLLPDAGEEGDGSGFNGIFLRWMAKFMKDRNLQGNYLAWLQMSANAAWNVRRTSDNLSWPAWTQPTPTTGVRHSFGCSNAVIALQVVPADGAGVTFYQDINFGGAPSYLVGTGSYTTAQMQSKRIFNEWATSLRVPTGWQVTMFENDNFTGASWTFNADAGWIGGDANDKMSSCRIQTTGVFFYQDANYLGSSSQVLAKGNYTLSQLQAKGVSNDWASSLRVPPGWTVTLYQHDNFTGTSWSVTSDSSYVGAAANDQMSSCRIQ